MMNITLINRLKPESAAIAAAAAVLRGGGVIVHPTETCYGLAVRVDQETSESLDRLYVLKKMERAKPISILVQNLTEAEQYGVFDARARALAQEFWPGPLTIIVPRTRAVPHYLNPGAATIAMRVPSCAVSLALVSAVGAVTTTSANVSGASSPYSIAEMILRPDLIMDGGVLPRVLPSTIVDTTVTPWRIVREGPISQKELLKFL